METLVKNKQRTQKSGQTINTNGSEASTLMEKEMGYTEQL